MSITSVMLIKHQFFIYNLFYLSYFTITASYMPVTQRYMHIA